MTRDDCGDVFSSTKILELHACDKTSSESEREDRDATSTEYDSESSGNESGGDGDEHNQINPEVVRQQYRIRYPQLTNKQINQATNYYMTEIRNRSAGMANHKGLCRNEDLGVSDVQRNSCQSDTDTNQTKQQKQTAQGNAWGIEVGKSGVGMIDNETALIDHEREEIELPRGISQLYTNENKGGNVFHIQLPVTNEKQHWSVIRTDMKWQTIDYRNSRLTVRVDKLREITTSAKTESTIVYTPISS